MIKDLVACVICGVVHTGTTITMKMLNAHPDLCGPFEGHVLRLKTVGALKTNKKRRGVIKSAWRLNVDQLNEAANQNTIEDLYRYLRKTSRAIKPEDKGKKLIDKTPSYMYHLGACLNRSEDIPFIVILSLPAGKEKNPYAVQLILAMAFER